MKIDPTMIYFLWAIVGLCGFALVDFRYTWVPLYWSIAGPLGFVASAYLGWRHARRTPGGEAERQILAHLESLYTPAAVKAMGDLGEADDPLLRCIPYGVPRSSASSPWPFQIVQRPGVVTVLTEYYHSFRLIPYGDGLEHADDLIPTYFGDSVGRWDGDTLVVDVVALNDKTWLADGRDRPTPASKGRWPHSDALHVVERWRAVDADTIEYEAVVEDPKMLSGPWTTPKITAKRTPVLKIGEGICFDTTTYSLAVSGKGKP